MVELQLQNHSSRRPEPSQDRLRPRQLSPKTGSRNRGSVTLNETLAASLASRQFNDRLQSDGVRHAHGIGFMRMIFWLSRASAPCGGIRAALQMPHACVTLHFALLLTYCSHEYRERNKHTDGISGCQRNRKKRLPSSKSRFFYAFRFRTRPAKLPQ